MESEALKLNAEKQANPESAEEIVAALDQDIRSAEWILGPLHRQWFENIVWFVGEQYLEYGARSRRFQPLPVKQHVTRATTNYILPHVETGVAILDEALPAPKVVPETGEDSDRIAAEIAQGALRYRDEAIMMTQKQRDANLFCVVCGHVYLQAILDQAMRETIRIPLEKTLLEPVVGDDGIPVLGPNGQPAIVAKQVPVIDPNTQKPAYDEVVMIDENVEVLAPFEIVPDWNAKYPWAMRRYTHFRPQAREWIGRAFGSEAKKKVKAETGQEMLVWHQLKVMDILLRSSQTSRFGLPVTTGVSASDWRLMEDMAVVKARYMLPTDEHPDGRIMITASGEVLHDGTYEYGDRLNLFTMRWSAVPGSLFGMGMVRNMISPQKRLNGIDTQIDTIRKTMGNPQWLNASGNNFDGDRGTGAPGHIYRFTHRSGKPAPQRLPPVNAPADAHQQRVQIVEDMEHISGMMNVLRGDRPVGVEAGVAIEALTEQAGKRFSPHLAEMRAEKKRMYLCRLEIMRRSTAWQYPRPVPLVGEDGKRDIRHFQAADFQGSLTIDIEAIPMIALSRALKKQNFVEGVNFGLVDIQTSLRNRERARSLLNLSEFDEQFTLDYKRAQMENEMILAGQPARVGPFDNHQVHLAVLMEIIKGREFDNLPEPVRKMALLHAFEHKARIEEEMLLAAASAAPAQGGEAKDGAGSNNGQKLVNVPGVVDTPTLGPPPQPGVQ